MGIWKSLNLSSAATAVAPLSGLAIDANKPTDDRNASATSEVKRYDKSPQGTTVAQFKEWFERSQPDRYVWVELAPDLMNDGRIVEAMDLGLSGRIDRAISMRMTIGAL